jgi:xylulokinase
MNSVIGIDLGTQSVKVVFYDFAKNAIVANESAPLDLYQDDTGVAEQQSQWWLNALHDAVAQVDPDVRKTARAIAVSGQQHGFVAVDKSNEVLAPVKLWCDTSTAAECDEIMDAFGGRDASIEKVGNPIVPGYTASKVRWLKHARPELYEQLDCILLPHDYLNLYLTGERCMETGDASGTGFLDVRKREWSPEMLQAVDAGRNLGECLPSLRTENEPVGHLRAEVAAELDLPAGIPVAIGGGDNMMGAIGTGNVRPGNVTMSLGTSGTVYAYADNPVVDPNGNIAAFCSSTGGWLPLLCTMNCTVSTELMRDLLGADIASFESQISKAGRGSDGVVTLPFFNGERTPNLPNAKGCIVGLDSHNTRPENLLRSAVEGATFALRFGIDELASLGVDAREIVVTGGGAKSNKWRQLVADICGVPVVVLDQDEGAAFGAALQALQLVEPGTIIEELVDTHLSRDESRCCEPREAAVTNYRDFYQDYQRAVEAVAALYR